MEIFLPQSLKTLQRCMQTMVCLPPLVLEASLLEVRRAAQTMKQVPLSAAGRLGYALEIPDIMT